jgi:hypothetical protein
MQRGLQLLGHLQTLIELSHYNLPLQSLLVRRAPRLQARPQLYHLPERVTHERLSGELKTQVAFRPGRQRGQVELLRGEALLFREVEPARILRLRDPPLVLLQSLR